VFSFFSSALCAPQIEQLVARCLASTRRQPKLRHRRRERGDLLSRSVDS
jgi:hypothetical protein